MGNKKLEPRKFQDGGTFVMVKKQLPKVELIKKYFESKLPKNITIRGDMSDGSVGDYTSLIYSTANALRDSGVINDDEYNRLFDEYEDTKPYSFNDTEYYTEDRVNEITNELTNMLRELNSSNGNKLLPKKQDGGNLKLDVNRLLYFGKFQGPENSIRIALRNSKDPKEFDYLFDNGVNWGKYKNNNKYKLDKLIGSFDPTPQSHEDQVLFHREEEKLYDILSRWNNEGRITDDEYNYAFDKIGPLLSPRKLDEEGNRLMPKKQDGGTLDYDRMDAFVDALKDKPEDVALDLISSWNEDGFIDNNEYDYLFNYAVNQNGSAGNAEMPASGNGEQVGYEEAPDNEVNMEGNPSGESEGENGKYVVKKGDSLWKIAKDHGMTVAELRSLNPKFANSNLIHPDDVLNVGTHSYSEYGYSDFDKAYAKAYREQQPTFEFNGKLYATPFKTAEQETPIQEEEENNEPEESVNESDTFMNELNSIAGETKNDESRSELRKRNKERREKRKQERKDRREERKSERKDREARILERSRNRR